MGFLNFTCNNRDCCKVGGTIKNDTMSSGLWMGGLPFCVVVNEQQICSLKRGGLFRQLADSMGLGWEERNSLQELSNQALRVCKKAVSFGTFLSKRKVQYFLTN